MTPREIAFESGLGLMTIYDAIHRGKLPHERIGRRHIVSRVNYQNWLAGLGKTAA
jgi:excisionase family DNA binding protein